jgi:MFS family permease
MTISTAGPADARASDGFWSSLGTRQLSGYPDTAARSAYLGLTVLITIALYYELYVSGSVSTLQLTALHMSFTFYVALLAFGNLIGAFGSLLAGLADRIGRCNLVVSGLLVTGIMTAVVLPEASSRWAFGIEGFAVGLVEGICLVATPALVRDFSPQVGRGVAMGFWTMGPVLGSLVVSAVGSSTIAANASPGSWPHEYRICGIVGLAVFVIAFLFLRELSPGLRDQLMVSTRDRALVEAKAKGLDIEASLKHPFRQLLKVDIIVSAFAVAVLLLAYYTAVGFGTIYFTTIFHFTVKQANGISNWNWGTNAVALVAAGVISDRFRVRKPFMLVGGIWAAVALVIYLSAAGHADSYGRVALLTTLVSFGLGIAYVSWMASFTESVEARNPALTATGLAIWGWIIRVVIFGSFLLVPQAINTVTPLVNYGGTVSAYATQYGSEFAFAAANPQVVAFATKNAALLGFAQTHADVIADAQKYKVQLADAQRFAPELKVIEANPALFTKLASYSNPSSIPPALLAQAVKAAGGSTAIIQTIAANKTAIDGVIAVAPQLQAIAKYGPQLLALQKLEAAPGGAAQLAAVTKDATQLKALAAVPKPVLAYMSAHANAVQAAAVKSPSQWKHWYWLCFGGVILFLGCIPLLKGRWSPAQAKADEEAHEVMVAQELARLRG